MAEQLLNGRYRLLRPLGTGGMASVYLAEDLRLGRRVAVKVLHPQFASDPSFVTRFAYEARIAAGLVHPNVVQVYDVGHDGDRHYIVMEYVEGETLKDLITRQGALPVARALAIIGGVLAALELAHAHNLIHRDIKAQNILLTSGGDVKVTDFGIARELSGTAAATTMPTRQPRLIRHTIMMTPRATKNLSMNSSTASRMLTAWSTTFVNRTPAGSACAICFSSAFSARPRSSPFQPSCMTTPRTRAASPS